MHTRISRISRICKIYSHVDNRSVVIPFNTDFNPFCTSCDENSLSVLLPSEEQTFDSCSSPEVLQYEPLPVLKVIRVPIANPNGLVLVPDVTFDVRKGRNVLITGGNGTGKVYS